MANAEGNLIKWQPGQSGNPAGHSKARRSAKRLREALDVLLEQELPTDLLESIPEALRQSLPDGFTFAEMIALRLTLIASSGTRYVDVLQAAGLILNAQDKPDKLAPAAKLEAPRLPTTEERRQAVAIQLGLDPDDETTIH